MIKAGVLELLIGVFIGALLFGQGTLALLLGLVLLALGVAQVWSRLVLRRVTYDRTLTPDRAFAGDTVTMEIRIRNPKLLGVPGLRVQDRVSQRLEIHGATLRPHTQPGSRLLERWTSLRPYEALTWHFSVQCQERGFYPFGPVLLEAGDPWGIYTSDMELPGRAALVVYPQLLSLAALQLNPRHLLGELSAKNQLLSDPSRTVGIRDYRRGDPFKAIHWAATARRGQLQTRVNEPTTSLELAIALDVDTFEHYWEGTQPELVEWMISAAATVATAAGQDRWSVGLYVNCAAADSDQFVRLAPSRSPAQNALILETLAKLAPFSIAPMAALLRRVAPTLPWGSTLLVITAVASTELQQTLLRLAEHGRRVLWMYCGEGETPKVPGVDIRHLQMAPAWQGPGRTASATPEHGKVGLQAVLPATWAKGDPATPGATQ
jgi:uncharacterized protein (DUF58 family)